MFKVLIPSLCLAEKKYAIHCLLREFIGVECNIEEDPYVNDYVIKYREKSLVIKNCFFAIDGIEELYIKENIPSKVDDKQIKLCGNIMPLLSIYGSSRIDISDNNIILYSDVVASTFFMLSRWEEYAIDKRDVHNRFSAKNALSFRKNFLNRPIVNEYVEILWLLFRELGFKGERKKRKYVVVPTHDEDRPFLWNGMNSKIRSLASSVIRKKKLLEAKVKLRHLLLGTDPFDTHDYLMDLSEKENVKSYFFFMVGGDTEFDCKYSIEDERIGNLIKHIEKRGHEIGIHPSYNSYDNETIFKNELDRISKVLKRSVVFGRHHFLRFEIPKTFQIWENSKMEWDSTLAYADQIGFRCGVCYTFSVFNILSRKRLKLKERPLIVMEGSLLKYQKLSLEDSLHVISKVKDQVKKYNGEFVFLWHNSSFNTDYWLGYEDLIISLYSS